MLCQVGWETGRPSEPSLMDANLCALRYTSLPPVVLYQNDTMDPLNPLGLLMAYAETNWVKPVVSDMDALLIGSKGFRCVEGLGLGVLRAWVRVTVPAIKGSNACEKCARSVWHMHHVP